MYFREHSLASVENWAVVLFSLWLSLLGVKPIKVVTEGLREVLMWVRKGTGFVLVFRPHTSMVLTVNGFLPPRDL